MKQVCILKTQRNKESSLSSKYNVLFSSFVLPDGFLFCFGLKVLILSKLLFTVLQIFDFSFKVIKYAVMLLKNDKQGSLHTQRHTTIAADLNCISLSILGI